MLVTLEVNSDTILDKVIRSFVFRKLKSLLEMKGIVEWKGHYCFKCSFMLKAMEDGKICHNFTNFICTFFIRGEYEIYIFSNSYVKMTSSSVP